VADLVKTYGTKRAVDGITFELQRGEIFALLGPNGAGKTTTVELLEGYRRPDSGAIFVLGLDPLRDAASLKPRMGAMPQESGLYPAITPREALDLFAHFYPRSKSPDELLRLVGLEDSAGVRYRRLSGGQKQRLSLALALLGDPEVVFLDEPTAGLDPQARRSTWDIIASLRSQRVSVLLTTHYLEEAERLADRIGIMAAGRLVAVGDTASLTTLDRSTVRVQTASELDPKALASLPSARSAQADGARSYVLQADDVPALLVELTSWLRAQRIDLTQLRVGHASLEEVFLELTGKEADP
jgi:ABC-2 type transport system ATP-binding protein